MTKMLEKSERFTIVTAIYENLLIQDKAFEINWDFIIENSIYENNQINLELVKKMYTIFLENSSVYEKKVSTYLKSYSSTPLIVKAILITLFLETDKTVAENQGLTDNFLGKYPRITQELIAGEYTSLINAIVRKVALDYNLKFTENA